MRLPVFGGRARPGVLTGWCCLILCLMILGCNRPAASETVPLAVSANQLTIGPDFLRPLLSDLPFSVQQGIIGDIIGFESGLRAVFAEDSDLLVLVDRDLSLPASYVPPDLVDLDSLNPPLLQKPGKSGMQVRRLLIADYRAMEKAAHQAGVVLYISSAYRSFEYQTGTFARNVKEMGRLEALRVSAEPGHSQHQLGLAIDFNTITNAFASTKAGIWLATHAGEYGFSLSFPKGKEAETGYDWESWHYRYIGKPACDLQARYFQGSQHAMLSFLDRYGSQLKSKLGVENATTMMGQ